MENAGARGSKIAALAAALFLLSGGPFSLEGAESFRISGSVLNGRLIKISFSAGAGEDGDRIRLYRSTRPLDPEDLDEVRFPITSLLPSPRDVSAGFSDTSAAHNATYHYLAARSADGRIEYSNVISLTTADTPLPSLDNPEILIDKLHYTLEVRDGRDLKKSYPVILGRDPVTRKLHQDFRTTPEGIYRIYNLKRHSTFHRALDVDYPNPVDRARYELLRSRDLVPRGKGIGGEIQIHGQLRSWALERNWTWGCIALRNSDIEELFDHPDLGVGTPVLIVGEEIGREDIAVMRRSRAPGEALRLQSALKSRGFYSGNVDGILGRQTRIALGRFQIERGFPVTCAPDKRTAEALLGK